MFASKDLFLTRPSGYQISRSVRLRSSASAYFNRTLTTPTNNKIFTISAWIKRGSLSTSANHQILSGYVPATSFDGFFIGGSASTYTDKLVYFDNTAGYLVSTQVFRDPSAWYHIMAAVDTTQATASNRVKLYVNGTQITSFSTTNYPSLNQAVIFNSAVAHTLGSFGYNSTAYYDGYMTEINFIDGQALTPSSFGETNSVTGVWQPKKYGGTYGTNGFYLNFSDNSAATAAAIGKDYSGNGNNWTPNNISVTAGVTYDSMVDSPTVSAASSNYCVLNPLQPASTTVVVPTDGNLKMTGTASGNNVTGTMAIGTTTYFEGTVVTGGGTVEYGIKNLDTGNTYVYDSNGNKYLAGTGTAYGATFTTSDIIGVAIDPTNLTLQFYKNGTSQGVISSAFPSGNYVPFFYASNTNASAANFGQRPFTYTPPSGFVALNTQNLPTPTISNGATVMAATLYTGTSASGNTQTLTFSPDFVWLKNRTTAASHNLMNTVVGNNLSLQSNTTGADNTIGFTFGTNSFTINATGAETNASGNNYVAWSWNAGGSTVTNTSGTISAQVRANATAGFSVVTYTGTGANATVGHGLGVAPSMIIVKNRSSGTTDWAVYHKNLTSAAYYLWLNSTQAQATSAIVWNSTTPTSSVFSIGTGSQTNGSTNSMVAYCFAAVAGYSAFGSYTGNGSADGPFVYLGFRPRFIMIKRTDAVGGWTIEDSSRDTYNATQYALQANQALTEATLGAYPTDFVSNGFKIRTTSTDYNANTGTFIYMAFAENPFKLSLAR